MFRYYKSYKNRIVVGLGVFWVFGNLAGMMTEAPFEPAKSPLGDRTNVHINTPPPTSSGKSFAGKSPKKSPKSSKIVNVLQVPEEVTIAQELDSLSVKPGGGIGEIRRGIEKIVVTPPDEKRFAEKENIPDGKAAKKTESYSPKKEQKYAVKQDKKGTAILFDRVDWLNTRVGKEVTTQEALVDDVSILLASVHAQLLLTINIAVRANLQEQWFRLEEDQRYVASGPGGSEELYELLENYNQIYALMHHDLTTLDEKSVVPYVERFTESLLVINQFLTTHLDVYLDTEIVRLGTKTALDEAETKRLEKFKRAHALITDLLNDYYQKKDTRKKTITRDELVCLVEVNTDLLLRNVHFFIDVDTWKYPPLTTAQQALFAQAKLFLDDALDALNNELQKRKEKELLYLRADFRKKYPELDAKEVATYGVKEFKSALKHIELSKDQTAYVLTRSLSHKYSNVEQLTQTLYTRWFRQAHEHALFQQLLSSSACRYITKELNRFFSGDLKQQVLQEVPHLKLRGSIHDDGFLAGSMVYRNVIHKTQKDFLLLPQQATTEGQKQRAQVAPELLFVETQDHVASMLKASDNDLFEDCCTRGDDAGVKRLFDSGVAITDASIMKAYQSGNPKVIKIICDELSQEERFAAYFTILKQASIPELATFVKRKFDVHLTQDVKDPVTLLGKLVDLLCKKNAQYDAQHIVCVNDFEAMLKQEAIYFAERIRLLMRLNVKYVSTVQKELATESLERSYEEMIERLHSVADASRELSLVKMIFDQRYLAREFILHELSTSYCFDYAVHIFIQDCLQINDEKMVVTHDYDKVDWNFYVERFGVEIDKIIERLDEEFAFKVTIIRQKEQPETLLAAVVDYIVRKNYELRDVAEDQLKIMADRYVAMILHLVDTCQVKYVSLFQLKHCPEFIKHESNEESYKSMTAALCHAADGFREKKLAYFVTRHPAFEARFDLSSFNITMDHLHRNPIMPPTILKERVRGNNEYVGYDVFTRRELEAAKGPSKTAWAAPVVKHHRKVHA